MDDEIYKYGRFLQNKVSEMEIKKIIKKYKIIVDIVKIYVILKLTKRKIERKKQCLTFTMIARKK